ncbi:MAG: protein kinase [Deltaproteobacteria bacterium]|nr:protein kinase [Deltaproteobacteria bacterium]
MTNGSSPSSNASEPRAINAPPQPPNIPGYVPLEKLASGGMATVWLAQRKGSEVLCVIKQLHPHLAEDRVVTNRFLREAAVASELDHPGIARVIDAGRQDEVFYIAVEFIAGQDLETMMRKLAAADKMLPPALSLTTAQHVLEALDFAHGYRDSEGRHLEIVHRDLSPRNVMLTYEGDVKIIDFGLARTNLGSFRTAPGMVLGTLRYMSPEQAVAEPVDLRSDLYSFSVVLYEMLSGRPLIRGDTPSDILRAVVTVAPKPLSELNPSLPPALDAVFAKALEKDREARYPAAEALRQALMRAAPQLSGTEASDMGVFVSELFPEEREQAGHWVTDALLGEHTQDPTRVRDAPEFLATRVGAAEDNTVLVSPERPAPTRIIDPSEDLTRATQLASRGSGPHATASVGRASMDLAGAGPSNIPTSHAFGASQALGPGGHPSAHPLGSKRRPQNRAVVSAVVLAIGALATVIVALALVQRSQAPAIIQANERPSAAASPRTRATIPEPQSVPPGARPGDGTRPGPGTGTGAVPTPSNNGESRREATSATAASPETSVPHKRQPEARSKAKTKTDRTTAPSPDPTKPIGVADEEARKPPKSATLKALQARIRAAKSEREVQQLIQNVELKRSTRDCIDRWIYISFNQDRVSDCLDMEAQPK